MENEALKRGEAMKLVAIVGATATGKTRLGVAVAHALGSEILSADSRQVYRGLDIGTGKDLGDYAATTPAVPYHLIDIVDPGETYTLYRYQRDCYALLEELRRRAPFTGTNAVPPVLVGGSALYIAAVLADYRIPDVPEDPALRAELAQRDLEELRAELVERYPAISAETDVSTKGRVIRGLEIGAFTKGGPIPYAPPLSFDLDVQVFCVGVERAELHRRIDARLAERLDAGLIEEVQGLLEAGVSEHWLRRLGLEYVQVCAHLAGEKDRDELQRDLAAAIHNFAKRQETWFRGFPAKRGIPLTRIGPRDEAVVLDALGRA